ncbi:MAG: hypothetical protein IJY87_00975 [Bacilli bacterium]|nr:hypothetical protein [Bacilli bacterium]
MFEYLKNTDDYTTTNEEFIPLTSSMDIGEEHEFNSVNTLEDNLYSATSWKYISNDSLHGEVFKLKKFLLEEFQKVDIELGIKSKIENFVSDNYSETIYVALSEIFAENMNDHELLIKIIRCLTLIPYDKLNSGAKLLAYAALQIPDKLVQQQSVQAFGIWSDPTTINMLQNVDCKEKWFEKYILKIIEGIKEENGM